MHISGDYSDTQIIQMCGLCRGHTHGLVKVYDINDKHGRRFLIQNSNKMLKRIGKLSLTDKRSFCNPRPCTFHILRV